MNKKSVQSLTGLAFTTLFVLTSACQQGGGNPFEGILPYDRTDQNENQVSFAGTIQAGKELGEIKQYCAEGLYLVADEGFLIDQTSILLLRVPDSTGQPQMLSDPQYIGKHVNVIGRYPVQEIFCEALICQCDDYILVERIDIL